MVKASPLMTQTALISAVGPVPLISLSSIPISRTFPGVTMYLSPDSPPPVPRSSIQPIWAAATSIAGGISLAVPQIVYM